MKTFLHSPVILFTLLAAISGCDAAADPAAAPTNAGKVDDGKTTTPVTSAALPKAGGAPKVLEDSSTRLARRLAEKFDALWDKHPTDGTASLRLLLRLDGKPFGGKLNILSDFRLVVRGANRGATHSQGFNPNKNGRFVYTQLDAGTYDVQIESEGYGTWSQSGVEVTVGQAPLFEVDLVASS